MKKLFKLVILMALIYLQFSSIAQAQDVDKSLADFTQQFQDAYNKEDHATLQTFYTADAVRVDREGVTIKGAEQIGAFWAQQFQGADATLTLTQTLVSWSDANHARVAKGTYKVSGTTVKGDKFELSGSYSNIMHQQDGLWKIAHSTLTE